MNPNSGFDGPPRPIPERVRMPEVRIAAKSVASEKHPDRNEDAFFHQQRSDGLVMAGVFDGVGGLTAGDKASRLAKDHVYGRLSQMKQGIGAHSHSGLNAEDFVKDSLAEADSVIRESARESGEMGSTGSVVVICDQDGGLPDTIFGTSEVVIGQVGDSRVYRLRAGELEQLTIDDSEVGTAHTEGEVRWSQQRLSNASKLSDLSPEDQELFRRRNVVTQALGGEKPVDVGVYVASAQPKDRFLIVSDGVSDNLTTDEIQAILETTPDSQGAVNKLIEGSLTRSSYRSMRSKPDDMTAVVIDIGSMPRKFEAPQGVVEKPVGRDIAVEVTEQAFHVQDGSEVYVMRHSGKIEKGWVVGAIDPKSGKGNVIRVDGDGQILHKPVDMQALDELNRPTVAADIAKVDFATAKTSLERRERIIHVVRRLKDGGINGSKGFYQSDQLTTELQTLFDHPSQDGINLLTNTGGLREKVRELINIELAEQRLRENS